MRDRSSVSASRTSRVTCCCSSARFPARVGGSTSLTYAQLLAVVFVTGTLTVFFDVAYQSILPAIVERDQLTDGNAKLEISRSARRPPGRASAVCSCSGSARRRGRPPTPSSFVVSALFIRGIRADEPPPRDRHRRRSEPLARARPRDSRRPALRAAPPRAAHDRGQHRDVELLLLDDDGGVPAVRRARTALQRRTHRVVFSIGNVGVLVGRSDCRRVTRVRLGPAICSACCSAARRCCSSRSRADAATPSVFRGRVAAVRFRRNDLQHRPGEPAPGDHAAPAAGPHERVDALHGVGDDAVRFAGRRALGTTIGLPPDDARRRHRWDASPMSAPGRVLAAPEIPAADANAPRGSISRL